RKNMYRQPAPQVSSPFCTPVQGTGVQNFPVDKPFILRIPLRFGRFSDHILRMRLHSGEHIRDAGRGHDLWCIFMMEWFSPLDFTDVRRARLLIEWSGIG